VAKEGQQQAVYANRQRLQRSKGKRLLRQRSELIERSFAHCYETGGMRRTHLRKHNNILKRLLIHVAGANLGLLLRRKYGNGTPRSLQGLSLTLRFLCGSDRMGIARIKSYSFECAAVTNGHTATSLYHLELRFSQSPGRQKSRFFASGC
jgi:hypothetical protein